MSELLLDRGLATSEPDSLVTQVARANTVSVIRRLDSGRRGILLKFLFDSNLLGKSDSVALLSNADLSNADLIGARLIGANLSGAYLSGVKGVGEKQLEEAKSLEGATMPNGSIHD
jgi:uncharacterized protein YjbI with pentapeptide repeats